MIRINGLKKTLSDAFTLSVGDLQINDGERVALIGMNGSGKSTLLRLIAGELEPDEGTIEYTGPAKTIGYEPQSPYAFRGTIRSNILLGAKDLGEEDLDRLLENCRLAELKQKKSSELSGGEKQRMCFARMLAGCWPTLLLDEPLSAVDIQMARTLERALVQHCEENGTTLLMCTHLPAQAMAVSTKVLLMDGGQVIEYTDTEQFRTPQTDFAKEFIAQWDIRE